MESPRLPRRLLDDYYREAMRRSKRAFTLVETLAVTVIVVVLSGVALVVAQQARGAATRTYCVQNLRQLDTALRLYGADWDDLHTRPPSFSPALEPYVRAPEVFRCRADTLDRKRRLGPAAGTYADWLYDTNDSRPRAPFQNSYWFRGYAVYNDPQHQRWRRNLTLPKMGIIVCVFHAQRDAGFPLTSDDDHMGPRNGPCLRIVPDGSLYVGHARSRDENGRQSWGSECFTSPHSIWEERTDQ